MEFGARWTSRAGKTAQSLRHQRASDDHGLSRRTPASGNAARRLSLLEQHRPHHPRIAAIGDRRPRLPGLALRSGLRTNRDSWHQPRILRGVHRGGARSAGAGGNLQPYIDVLFRRGVDRAFDELRAAEFRGPGHAGRIAALLERDLAGELFEAAAGAADEVDADLGDPRLDVPAGVLAAGAGHLSPASAAPRGLQPAVRPLHHRAVPFQSDGRAGDVPLRRPAPVTQLCNSSTTSCGGALRYPPYAGDL